MSYLVTNGHKNSIQSSHSKFKIRFNINILPTLLSPELHFHFRAVRPITYVTSQADTLPLKLGVVFVVCVRQWCT